jgi:Domain of unknown function (DUF5011)/Leucine Rich repeats (2 copies)
MNMKRLNVVCMLLISLLILSGCQLLNQDPDIQVYEHFALEYEVNSKEPDWLSAIKVSDKEDGDLDTSLVDVDATDVDMSKLGSYQVSYSVKDSKGSKSVKKIDIKIVDREKPVIKLQGDDHIRVMIDFEFKDPGVLVTDNHDEDLADLVKVTSDLDITKIGTYKISYNVTDSSGNEAEEVVRTITVVDDISSFINDDLEKVIRFYLEKPEGKLTKMDCAKIINLIAINSELTSLDGIQYLTNLKTLDLSNNQIADLSPLAKLANLEKLNLTNNLVTDLTPVSKLTTLKWLSIQYNDVTDVSPLKNLTSLYHLNLANNEIFDISQLNKLNKLEVFRLEYNNIDNIGIIKSLHLNGAFRSEASKVFFFSNPVDVTTGNDSYQAIMYFVDHGIPFQHSAYVNPRDYTETYNSALSLTIASRTTGYIGFETDVDWYRLYKSDETKLQLYFTKNEMLNVEVYQINPVTEELVLVPTTTLDLVSNSVLDLPNEMGIYLMKVNMKQPTINFTYNLEVKQQAEN